MKIGKWKEAGERYLQCEEYKKAIDAFISHSHLEGLIDVCRALDAQQPQHL